MPEAVDILDRQVKDLERKNEDLVKDNGKQRDQLREARDTIKNLEGERDTFKAQVPTDGAVTLSKADAVRWQTYTGLGTVDDVTTKVRGYNDLEQRDKQRTREDGIKTLNIKPSIFEVIAKGAAYRTEGEGDDRKVLLTVDDKEVELSEHARAQGLEDLLGVMVLSDTPTQPKPPVPTGAGNRGRTPLRLSTPEEIAESQQHDPKYSI